jgi:hypothetical protein
LNNLVDQVLKLNGLTPTAQADRKNASSEAPSDASPSG